MAAATVFDNFELLEQILLQDLSTQEVVRARQINSFTRAVIENSMPLRRVIFLEPTLEKHRESWTIKGTSPAQSAKVALTLGVIHPAIALTTSVNNGAHIKPPCAQWPSGGQWEKMLITQPPAKEYRLLYKRLVPASQGDVWSDVRIDGNTLGQLRDAVKALGDRFEGIELESEGIAVEESMGVKVMRKLQARNAQLARRVEERKKDAEARENESVR